MTATAQIARRTRPVAIGRILRELLPWAVSAGIVWFVIAGQDLKGVAAAAGKANLMPFLWLTAAWVVVNLLLEGVFCHYGLVWGCGVCRFAEVLRARAAAYILTMLSSVLGYGGIVVYARRRFGVPMRRGAMLMATEALHEVGSMGILALGMTLWLMKTGQVHATAIVQLNGVLVFGSACVVLYVAVVGASRFFPRLGSSESTSLLHDFTLTHYAAFLGIKIVQNLIHGLWIVLALRCFGVSPPAIVSIAFTQVVHLVHGLPVAAFGIGVDQLMVPSLFSPWSPDDGGASLLAFSVAYTFAMVIGRASIGLLVVRRVVAEIKAPPLENPKESK